MCKVLSVSKSGYYRWRKGQTYLKEVKKQELLNEIKDVFKNSHETYGYRRVYRELKKQGKSCYRAEVTKLMKENDIKPKQKRKFVTTTLSSGDVRVSPNLLNREFTVFLINKVWVSDITFIWTSQGWLYLCIILDLGSRNIAAWRTDSNMRSQLIEETLRDAIETRNPPKGLLFHSDRGSQYGSDNVREILDKNEIIQSMSRRANCWDNAVAESFFKTIKYEFTNKLKFKTRLEAELAIFEYIEFFYKRKRLHSAIGYMTPVEYEEQYLS